MQGRQTQHVRWSATEEEWQHRCGECRQWWPLTFDFWTPRHGMARCKACWAEYQRLYQAERRGDPEVVVGIRAAQRAKYAAIKDIKNARTREWKARNREHIRAYQREYYARTRDRQLEYKRLYAARKHNSDEEIAA